MNLLKQSNITVIKIYLFFIFWFFYFNFLPAFFVQSFSNKYAIFLSILTVIFFTIGYILGSFGTTKEKMSNMDISNTYKFYYIYISIFILSYFFKNLFTPLLALISAHLIIKLLSSRYYIYTLMVTIMSASYLFMQYTRMYILMIIIYIFMYFYIKNKKFYLLQIVTVTISGLFLLIVMLYQRVFQEINLSKIFTYLNKIDIEDFFKLVDNYFVYEAYLHTLEYFPKYHLFLYGDSLIKPFIFWIPRSIWEDKPEGLTTFLPKLFYGTSRGSEYSTGMTITGEFYVNFGLLGVVLFSFLFGYISIFITKKLLTSNKEEMLIIALMYIVYFPHLIRGGIGTTVVFELLFSLFFILFFRMPNIFKRINWRK